MANPYLNWLQWYKKPSYVDIREYAAKLDNGDVRASSPSRVRSMGDIPARLTLKRILANQTCSPMSLHDFYMYLKHIEHSSENLEFYIWFKDYERRYAEASRSAKQTATYGREPDAGSKFSQDDLTSDDSDDDHSHTIEKSGLEEQVDPEQCSDMIMNIETLISLDTVCSKTTKADNILSRFSKSLPGKFLRSTGTGNQDTKPDFPDIEASRKEELAVITALFLTNESTKELNIPPAMRKQALDGIAASSSPHHLKPIATHCYQLLHSCSHRNFVRLGVSNGTMETICVATSLGIVLVLASIMCVLLLAFAHPRAHWRWEVLGLWPMWCIGVGLVLSGLRGSCFFLLLFSRRQPLPWERIDDSSSEHSEKSGIKNTIKRLMVFDQKIRVQDSGLRQLQRKIVAQSLVGGAVFATLMVIFFTALPIWR